MRIGGGTYVSLRSHRTRVRTSFDSERTQQRAILRSFTGGALYGGEVDEDASITDRPPPDRLRRRRAVGLTTLHRAIDRLALRTEPKSTQTRRLAEVARPCPRATTGAGQIGVIG